MTLRSRDTRVSTPADRLTRSNAALLAEIQAFLEASLVSRPDLNKAATLADACLSTGETSAGDALRAMLHRASESYPELLESAAAALNVVEGIRAVSRPKPVPPVPAVKAGRVGCADNTSSGDGTVELLARLSQLAERAAAEPEAFVSWARTVLSKATRDLRGEIVWALPAARSLDAARLITSTPGLGRCTADALLRIQGAPDLLGELVRESLIPPTFLEPEIDAALIAVSALIRLGLADVAIGIKEARNPDLAAAGEVLEAATSNSGKELDLQRNPGQRETFATTLERGLAAIFTSFREGDRSALESWLDSTDPRQVLRVGRFVAGWPEGEFAGRVALEQWIHGSSSDSLAALIAGIEPSGTASQLIERGRPQDIDLVVLLAGLESKIAILGSIGDPQTALDPQSLGALKHAGTTRTGSIDAAMARFSNSVQRQDSSAPLREVRTYASVTAHEQAEAAATGDLAALDALIANGDPSARRYEELLLTSPYPPVAQRAAGAVAARGRAGARYASRLLDSGEPSLTEAAFQILARSSLEDARDDLIDALSSNDPWLLRAAASAAGEAAAATQDREVSRALINAMTRIAGGALAVVPEVAAIGNARSIDQLTRLNERGQLFDSGRDDHLLMQLISAGESRRFVAIEDAVREREALHASWRAEGRIDEFGGGRIGRAIRRLHRKGGRISAEREGPGQ